MSLPRWGVVATVKAPAEAVLNFAAHHLELGAHRLYIYLDAPDPDLEARLSAHPKLRARHPGAAFWRRHGPRPDAHQERQVIHARHAYARRAEVDWLAHIDVDEFLWPARPLAEQLAESPPDCLCLRLAPAELLAPDPASPPGPPAPLRRYKQRHAARDQRQAAAPRLYPRFGDRLEAGFLSHVAGKMIYRTGVEGLRARLHNVRLGDVLNPGERPLPETLLLHHHAASWEEFERHYRYRLSHGAYRAALGADSRPGGPTRHALFAALEAAEGATGLRAFFEEVCTDRPALREALAREGLLAEAAIDFPALRAKHFPA